MLDRKLILWFNIPFGTTCGHAGCQSTNDNRPLKTSSNIGNLRAF